MLKSLRRWAPVLGLLAASAGPALAQDVLVRLAAAPQMAGGAASLAAATMAALPEVADAAPLAARGPLSGVVAVTFGPGIDAAEAAARLAALPGVASVQPNVRYSIDRFSVVEVPWDSLPHLVAARVREAHRITTGTRRVRVALLDTGLWFEHPALRHAVWTNPREIPRNGLDDDGNGFVDDVHGWDFVDRPASPAFGDVRGRDNDPSDDNIPGGGRSHGTYVAGVVGARYLAPLASDPAGFAHGVAPDVSLVPLRVCAADGGCDDDDVAAALVYAADMGFEVVNMSFGTDYSSEVLRTAAAYAASKGVVMVASAGNQPVARPHYPSDFPEVLSAVWLVANGDRRASNAQFGPGVDVGAPASLTHTTAMPLPDQAGTPGAQYLRLSGSSFAAPVVTGIAALLLSQDSTLSAAAVRSTLLSTARDLGAPGWDEQTGHGLVQADAALLRALPAHIAIASPEQDGGTAAPRLPILGTVLDPSFASYEVAYAAGDSVATAWTRIGAVQTRPRLRDTLAVWATAGLAEGVYTLRLRVTLREGRTLEERRRVWIDRTPPRVTVVRALAGYEGEHPAALYEVVTDDLTHLAPEVGGVPSDRIARRHGLAVAAPPGATAAPPTVLVATNRAGLTTRVSAPAVVWAERALDPALLVESPLAAPAGVLLPVLTDFNGNGRREVTVNRALGEATSDTTLVYEWNGAGLTLLQRTVVERSSARPRDAGDPDGDGRADLLIQSGGTSGLLEAVQPGGAPSVLAYVSPDTLFAARLTDLDRDGRGEILGHNGRAWRVYEWSGSAYARVAHLPNPTPLGTGEVRDNLYSEPEAAVGDFDGDGQTEFAVLDLDGDLVVYEARGDNRYDVAWTEPNDRYGTRPKTATGDFDGDGRPDFVVLRENFEATRATDRQQEPPLATFTAYRSTSGDAFASMGAVSFALPSTRYTATAAVDLDADGRAELVVAAGPRLYVFSWSPQGFRLRFYRGFDGRGEDATGLRSVTFASGDLDGDALPDLVAGLGTTRLARFTRRTAAGGVPAPSLAAAPGGPGTVLLAWGGTAGADSTVVLRDRAGALERVAGAPGCCALASVVAPAEASTYFVRAFRHGVASPLSAGIVAAAGPPQPVVRAVRLDTHRVRVEISLALPSDDLALLGVRGYAHPPGDTMVKVFARTTVSATQTRGFLLTFARRVPDGWAAGLTGTLPKTIEGAVAPPSDGLLLESAQVTAADEVRLLFSLPLDPSTVSAARFRVTPHGTVVSAAVDPANPRAVVVRLSGAAIGATGLPTALAASGLRSASGQALNEDGRALRLTRAAADLSGAYVFPNPVRPSVTPEGAMIAGLPASADIAILSVDGQLLRRLEERDGDGGVRWDLTDAAGRAVPSGVYLVRIVAPEGGATMVRLAVLR